MNGWITTPIEAGLVRGAAELERTGHGVRPHRLPAAARKRFLVAANAGSSGTCPAAFGQTSA
jgi:hypothetical protein